MSQGIFARRRSSKYRLLLIAIFALLVYVSQISVQGMSPGEVTPDQAKLARSALPDGTDGGQNLDVSNAVLSFTQQAAICPGDFDGNGEIGFADFLLFTGVFGTSSDDANYNALMDMDGNGEIGFADFLLFTGVFGTTCEAPPTSDRAVLVALYNATDGPNWKNNTNWLTDAPLGDWYGVEVDDAGRVVRLVLGGEWDREAREWTTNNLRGTIPAEIGNLSRLTYLNLGSNLLTGTIPAEIGSLANLEYLNLQQNNLVGEIPPELGNLTKLRTLRLGTSNLSKALNQLTGSIPSELGNLTNLRDLNLRYNDLTGGIPSELGKLAKLGSLHLEGNDLSGPIPPEIGNLTNLTSLYLLQNNLTDSIPPEIGKLARLRTLILSQNNLQGPIPPELGDLRELELLRLNENDLSGPIPHSFLDLAHLDQFWFGANDGLCAPGTAPFAAWLAEINQGSGFLKGPYCNESDVSVLESLFESANGQNWTNATGWLDGPVLENWHGVRVDTLGLVTALDLSENNLSGTLPTSLGRLDQLTELRLDGNPSLSGLIPLSLSLTDLSIDVFHYAETELCSPAAPSFREWVNTIGSHEGTGKECAVTPDREVLVALYEAAGGPNWTNNANWLTDAPLGMWHGIEVNEEGRVIGVNLTTNNLVGIIPSPIGYLTHLRRLQLDKNRLTGSIPREIAYLAQLDTLDVRYNLLAGSIPLELGNLESLKRLAIGGNSGFRGYIPPELGNLSALEDLWAGGCGMAGSIPPELGNLTNLRSLVISGPRLSGPIPPELGNLANLQTLRLPSSNLIGVIPPELGKLRSLEVMNLARNALSGPIPPELGNLANLRELRLPENLLSGSIPPELGDLRSLEVLELTGNALSNSLPLELGRLSNLEILRLGVNDLSGPIPAEFGELASLQSLYVNANAAMTGPLPASLSTLQSLETLQTAGTDLCVPQPLLEWLEGVPTQIVARCDAQFSGAYLSQAVQSIRFPVPLVAGKEALLRVFVTAARANNEDIPDVRASFFQGGTLTHITDIPGKPGSVPTTPDEGSLAKSANAVIPGEIVRPGLEMVIEIDPDGTLDPGLGVNRRIPETGRQRIDVRAMPVLDLTMIPLIWTLAPDSSVITAVTEMAADPENHEMLWDTRTLLPIGNLKVTAHEPVATSDGHVSSSLTTYHPGAWLRIAKAIRVMEGGTGHYMTILSSATGGHPGGIAELGGRASFAGFRAETIAHELGHNMSLRHAPCGTAAGIDPAYPNTDGTIGAYGYDFRDGGRLFPPQSYDLMSYCHPTWIGNYHFYKALRFRLSDEDASEATATPTPSLLLWGGKDAEDNPYLEPAFVVNAPPALPQSGGQYRITGQNAIHTELFSLTFDMPYVVHGDGSSSFAFVLPVDPDWKDELASITLTGPGGSFTLDSDTDQPMVILRNPQSGQVRGFLRDVSGKAMAASKIAADALSPEPGLEALFSRGLPGAEAYQR